MIVRKDHTMEFPTPVPRKPTVWEKIKRFIALFKYDPDRGW